ncbi:unnamed protein product [Gadus morhua 'NCC']
MGIVSGTFSQGYELLVIKEAVGLSSADSVAGLRPHSGLVGRKTLIETVLSPGLSCLQDCPVSRSALSPGLSCLQDCTVSCHLYSLEEKPGVGDCSLLDSHCQGQQCVL